MKLPYLNEIPTSHQAVDVFGGYNHNLRIGDGEFYHMENMTSDYYPVLSPRDARGVHADSGMAVEEVENAYYIPYGAIAAKDKLCCVNYDGIAIGDNYVYPYLQQGEKRLVSMGAYLIILPDGYYINTSDVSERGYIGEFSLSDGAYFRMSHSNGAPLEPLVATNSEDIARKFANADGVVYWYDTTSADKRIYKCYWAPAANGSYTTPEKEEITPYVSIYSKKIALRRYVGEHINISGATYPLEGLNADVITITACGDAVTTTYITVKGAFDVDTVNYISEDDITEDNGHEYISAEIRQRVANTGIYTPKLLPSMYLKSISARLPVFDHMCERGNRLWACRYGKNDIGVTVNEIYASMPGNFERWDNLGTTADSAYAMTVGSDGPFTGCTAFGDCTIFFKENCFHKVYGKIPEDFYSVDVDAPGVESGSDRSIAIVDGVLYYKSPSGVCAYDGSLPVNISESLGGESYKNAVACGFKGKYYISMRDSSGKWNLLIYDTRRRMWHREDGVRFWGCDSMGDEMYFSNGAKIYTVRGTGVADTEKIQWSCESGLIGTEDPARKYISKLNVRMSLPPDSKVDFYARYDSQKTPELIGKAVGRGLQTFTLPMRVRRCDHMTLIIKGEGETKIYSITKTIEEGSDVV